MLIEKVRVGMKVKIVAITPYMDNVGLIDGMTGNVLDTEETFVKIKLNGFKKGHGSEHNNWYVFPDAIESMEDV